MFSAPDFQSRRDITLAIESDVRKIFSFLSTSLKFDMVFNKQRILISKFGSHATWVHIEMLDSFY